MKLFSRSPRSGHIGAELLSAYLDHQVMAGERARIESHLAGCPTCQAELGTLRQTVALLHALPAMPVPRAFTLSEAQVGIHRPLTRPAWYGGVLQGLGAVVAVALVAVIATSLLRQPAWTPSETVARVAPAAPAPAEAPTAAPSEAAVTVAVEKAVAEEAALAAAPTPTAAPAVALEAQPAAEKPVEAPSQSEAAPAEAPAPEAEMEDMAKSAQQEPAPAPMADSTGAAMAMAAPETAPAVAAAGLGRGGGVGGGPGIAAPPEALTPAPAPPLAAIGDVLPAGVALVYADGQGVWTIDRTAGLRQLVATSRATAPLIAPNKDWIAYRVEGTPYAELWAVPWEGQDARLLLAEQELPKDDLGPDYSERRIASVRWTPGREALAVTTAATPKTADVLPKMELWNLDVISGTLQYVLDLGQAALPYFAPDGSKLVLLQRATEAGPAGSLVLYSAGGSDGQEILEFAGGPAVPSFESQVSWLPDSSGFWAAIPDPTLDFSQPASGVTLYRVPLTHGPDAVSGGGAEAVAHLDGLETFWSPDGTRLVYLRPSPETPGARDLMLSKADGSDPQVYATFLDGFFVGWSPDSERFLYFADYFAYAGGPDVAPQRLGNAPSVIDPRWLTSEEILYRADAGGGWVLILRPLDGEAVGLTWLPRDVAYDVRAP